MLYALDTNACIELLRGRSPALGQRMAELLPSQVAVPSLVYAELLLGAALSANPLANRRLVDRLVAPLVMLDFDARAAAAYAAARAALQARGLPIGPNDLIIAATAIANQAVLVSANTREFERVPGLQVEDWTR
jgi:tRNA(fMet)-specific endonuclease VapC